MQMLALDSVLQNRGWFIFRHQLSLLQTSPFLSSLQDKMSASATLQRKCILIRDTKRQGCVWGEQD